MKSPPAFPPPDSADTDDTKWALTTAAALWKTGRYRDALPWIQRAATAAARAHDGDPTSNVRVVELTVAAAELASFVGAWSAGDSSVDPSSIPISIEIDTDSIDVMSIPSEAIEIVTPHAALRASSLGVPRIPRPEPGAPPPRPAAAAAPAPRARTFAGTLQQASRPELPPSTVPVAVPRISAPKPDVVIRSGKRVLAATLPEAMSSPIAASKPPSDPFAGLDEPRLSAPAPVTPGANTQPAKTPIPLATTESVPTRRMEDVPTRRASPPEIQREIDAPDGEKD